MRKKSETESLDCISFKKPSVNYLPCDDFHIEMFTVVDDLLALCFATTVMTIPVFITTCSE